MSGYYKQCKCLAWCDEEPCYQCLKTENAHLRETLEREVNHTREAINQWQEATARGGHYREALERIAEYHPAEDDIVLCRWCYQLPEPHADDCPTSIAHEALREEEE